MNDFDHVVYNAKMCSIAYNLLAKLKTPHINETVDSQITEAKEALLCALSEYSYFLDEEETL